MSSGGDSIRMCGFSAFVRCGIQYFDTIKVPRVLMAIIRSNRFMSVAWELVRLMALALLTQISMPPNSATVLLTAAITWASSRISQLTGSALAAGRAHILGGGKDGAPQLRMRFHGLRGTRDISSVYCRAPRTPKPTATAPSPDKHHLA